MARIVKCLCTDNELNRVVKYVNYKLEELDNEAFPKAVKVVFKTGNRHYDVIVVLRKVKSSEHPYRMHFEPGSLIYNLPYCVRAMPNIGAREMKKALKDLFEFYSENDFNTKNCAGRIEEWLREDGRTSTLWTAPTSYTFCGADAVCSLGTLVHGAFRKLMYVPYAIVETFNELSEVTEFIRRHSGPGIYLQKFELGTKTSRNVYRGIYGEKLVTRPYSVAVFCRGILAWRSFKYSLEEAGIRSNPEYPGPRGHEKVMEQPLLLPKRTSDLPVNTDSIKSALHSFISESGITTAGGLEKLEELLHDTVKVVMNEVELSKHAVV